MAEEETVTKPPAGPPPKPKPEPVYTPPPAPPKPSMVEQARANIAAAKASHGFSITRPFRYTAAFVKGTITDGLNGIANWGQKGLKYGLVGGFIAGFLAPVGGGFAAVVGIAGVMFLGGAAIGGTVGLLTGGMKAVGRVHRGEKYAEDLVDRSKIQARAPENRADYRSAYQDRNARNIRGGIFTQQVLDREREMTRDENTYWQDREQRNPNGHGRGL